MAKRSQPRHACLLFACGLCAAACDDSLTFPLANDRVLIPTSFSTCREGQACTLTVADCSDCCGVEAVRSTSEPRVYEAVQRSCEAYDGPSCNNCPAIPRKAWCVEQRCTLIHTTTCSVVPTANDAVPGVTIFAEGTSNIKDPFSCNTCTCQRDGSLLCGNQDCARPCSAGQAPGTTCDSCGYNTNCDVLRTACLPSCQVDADCAGTPSGVCLSGVCKRVCGH